MQKLNFLPKSYTNRYTETYLKAYFFIFIFLLMGNIGMICMNFWKYIDYKNIKIMYDAEQIKTTELELSEDTENIENNNSILIEIYYDLKSRYSDQCFEEIEISKEDIKIKSSHMKLQQYINFVKAIEKDKKLKIVDLHPPVIGETDVDSYIVVNYIR